MKPFRFFIQPFPKGSHTIAQQMDMVFAQHDELISKFDQRVAWAKTRSQREDWWNLDLRSCSEHYALIDLFDRNAEQIRSQVSWDLMSALWGVMRREDWRTIKGYIALASEGVNQINSMFRPSRNLNY